MRIRFINRYNQGTKLRFVFDIYFKLSILVLFLLLLLSCSRNSNQGPLIPPPTNPLIREFIGYGVVTTSFAQVLEEPRQDGVSLAILRRASLVRIIERRIIRNRGLSEIWLFVEAQEPEGKVQGWLGENSINIFSNEVQAFTAAEAMNP